MTLKDIDPIEETRREAVHDLRQSVQSIQAWVELCRFYIGQKDLEKANDALDRVMDPLILMEKKAINIIDRYHSELQQDE